MEQKIVTGAKLPYSKPLISVARIIEIG